MAVHRSSEQDKPAFPLKEDDDPFTGWSLWHPLCTQECVHRAGFHSTLLTENRHSECHTPLPDGLRLVFDRTFATTTAKEGARSFDHYLIVPSRPLLRDELLALGNLIEVDECCVLRGTATVPATVAFDDADVEGAATQGYAVEWCLRQCAADLSVPTWRRVDAAVLAAWVGTCDPLIEGVAQDAPWAAAFMLSCLRAYEARALASRKLKLIEYLPIAKSALERSGLEDDDEDDTTSWTGNGSGCA